MPARKIRALRQRSKPYKPPSCLATRQELLDAGLWAIASGTPLVANGGDQSYGPETPSPLWDGRGKPTTNEKRADHAIGPTRGIAGNLARWNGRAIDTIAFHPAAWMRRHVSPGSPSGPPEIDYECYAGDEPPEDGNKDWVPLYRTPNTAGVTHPNDPRTVAMIVQDAARHIRETNPNKRIWELPIAALLRVADGFEFT